MHGDPSETVGALAPWRPWAAVGCALLGWMASVFYAGAGLGAAMSGLDPNRPQQEPPSPAFLAVPVGLIAAALALGVQGRKRAPLRCWAAVASSCTWIVLATMALGHALADMNR